MSCFTTRLSFNLLVKEFSMRPIALLSSKIQISPDKLNNLYDGQKLTNRFYVNRQINMSLLSTHFKLLLTSLTN